MPKKSPSILDYQDIVVERFRHPGQRQFTFFLRIPFTAIAAIVISIANRRLVHLGSGLVRHLRKADGTLLNPNGVRIVGDRILSRSDEKRVFHWDYPRHFRAMGLTDENDEILEPFIVNSNRDLGQNPWHVAYLPARDELEEHVQGDYLSPSAVVEDATEPLDPWVRLLEDDRYGTTRGKDLETGREYASLVIWKDGRNPSIENLRFNEEQNVFTADLGRCLSSEIELAISGKPLLAAGEFVSFDRLAAWYDVAHVLPVSDRDPEWIEGVSDRIRSGALLEEVYADYPERFDERMRSALDRGFGDAKYYFNIVGVDDEALSILHFDGSLEEAAAEARRRGMRDAIIKDEGGSVSCFGSSHGPRGGFHNVSSYFRPNAISLMGIRLAR